MKKITLTVLLFTTLLTSACAKTPTAAKKVAASGPIVEEVVPKPTAPPPAATQVPAQSQSAILNTDYENEVSVAMQLLLGTFKLEGTANAITKEQAASLTPLWTNFKTLSESMKPAQGEPGQQGQTSGTPQSVDSGLQSQLDEIIKQVQSVMTAEQIQAIADMKLTQETSRTIMEEQGITMGGPQQGGGNMQGGGQPPAGGGNMPQGTPPAGGGGQMGTPPDEAQPGGMGGFVPTELVNALLKLLSQKAVE